MVLASSDVGIETIAVLGFDAEELVHGLRQVLELHIAIRRRKNYSRTYFHDRMQEKLNDKMRKDDELERMRR
jgi:hypothetical protein